MHDSTALLDKAVTQFQSSTLKHGVQFTSQCGRSHQLQRAYQVIGCGQLNGGLVFAADINHAAAVLDLHTQLARVVGEKPWPDALGHFNATD